MNKIKVLHLGKYYPPFRGGIETHLKSLCEESLAYDIEPVVYVANHLSGEAKELINGVKVNRFPVMIPIAGAPFCFGLSKEIQKIRPDIVHLHHPHPGAIFSFLLSGIKAPAVLTYHSDIVRQKFLNSFFTPFLSQVLKRCVKIIATSPDYASSSVTLRPHLHKTEVIPLGNPLNLEASKSPEVDAFASELKNKYGAPLTLSVGRLIYYKGFEYAIRAIKDTEANLLIIGQGPLLNSLKKEVHELGVQDRVFFLGGLTDEQMCGAYKACDIYLMPSIARSEAFGLVQLEAMSFGKPVINTKLDSGVPYVSLDNLTGLTVPPRNSSALASAINKLLGDRKLLETFGKAAKLRADSEFSPKLMAQRTCDLYKTIHKSMLK